MFGSFNVYREALNVSSGSVIFFLPCVAGVLVCVDVSVTARPASPAPRGGVWLIWTSDAVRLTLHACNRYYGIFIIHTYQ